jgi:hypothetical protein
MAIVPTEKLTNRIVLLIGRHPLRQTQQQGAIRSATHGQEGIRPDATVYHVSLDFGFVPQGRSTRYVSVVLGIGKPRADQ